MTEVKDKKPAYYCSKCELAVIVIPNEKPIKACTCDGASIIADMEAVAIRSKGSFNG